ncbi:MAG TPA: hypothetical protein VHR45_05515 [Thermoanaerobaculia bacterium]|nr:hypothetical protein [Thermoanaerobaculia bacterium]
MAGRPISAAATALAVAAAAVAAAAAGTAAVAAAGTAAALSAAASPSAPAAAATGRTAGAGGAAGKAPVVLKDRVLAVVDEDPILASDLDRAIAFGQERPNPGEAERAFRRRVLDELIAERLRFHEIDRFGFEQVPVGQIEKNVAEIRGRFKDDAAFRQKLKELGIEESALRQLVARQLEVLAYVDERLGPQVFVGLDDIAAYYRTTLIPELERQHVAVPPLEDVREQIRLVLKQQRLVQEIDRWTEELRRKANISIYFDQPAGGPLPPVVKRFDKPAPAPGKKPRPAPPPAPLIQKPDLDVGTVGAAVSRPLRAAAEARKLT